jgi:hypothetical protein
MAKTVEQVLTAATDSVTLINAVNGGTQYVGDMTQAEINEMVQRNVVHLELILAYTDPLMSQETRQISLAIQMQLQLGIHTSQTILNQE